MRCTMDSLENAFLFLDYLTDTRRKRHMVGGILIKGEDNESDNS